MSQHLTPFVLIRHIHMMVCFDTFPEFMHGSSAIFPEAWDEFRSE